MGIVRKLGGALLALALLSQLAGLRHVQAQDADDAEVISEPPGSSTPAEVSPPPSPATQAAPPVSASPQAAGSPSSEPREAADLELGKPKQPLGIWRFGGGFGFSYRNDFIFLAVEPQASYLIKRIVEPGAALVYQWSKDRFFDPNVVRHTVGGRLFARVYPIRQLFILVEGELLNSGAKQGDVSADRENYPNLFLGGGFVFGLGKGAFFSTGLKVNIFTSDLYPDHFPIFSIGAGVGF